MPRHDARLAFARKRSTPSLLKPRRLMSASALGQPEQAGLRIARLRARCDGAAFDEAEAERRESVDVRGVLVEAGGESDPVGKVEPHRGDRRGGRARRERLHESEARRGVEARERQVVRRFGIECEEQRAEERVDHGAAAGVDAARPVAKGGAMIPSACRSRCRPPCRSDSVSLSRSPVSRARAGARARGCRRRAPRRRRATRRARTCARSSPRWPTNTASSARRSRACSGRCDSSARSWPRWIGR